MDVMDGWMDGWMDGRMDGWMPARVSFLQVVALQQGNVVIVCIDAALTAGPVVPETSSRFIRVMMLAVYTTVIPQNRCVFDLPPAGPPNAAASSSSSLAASFPSSTDFTAGGSGATHYRRQHQLLLPRQPPLSGGQLSLDSEDEGDDGERGPPHRRCWRRFENFVGVNYVVAVSAAALWLGLRGFWVVPLTALPCVCVAVCAAVRVVLLSD